MHWPWSRTIRRYARVLLVAPIRDWLRSIRPGRLPRLANAVHRPPSEPEPAPAPGTAAEPARPCPPPSRREWARLVGSLCEWDGYFFSDNLVSNESSYLHQASTLAALPKGLGYLGVGPEQSFSYLALLEPSLAFVVDIRRDNCLLHLLYKALFELSRTRSEWLALLLGRPYDAPLDAGACSSARELFASLEKTGPSEAAFEQAHARVIGHLSEFGLGLRRSDYRTIKRLHRQFFTQQLELSFQLRKPNEQRYPSLRALLLSEGPDRAATSFLGTERAFSSVRRLHQEHRIVPVVGDLAADHALLAIARELRRRRLPLGVVYASNVEQYLMEERRFERWIANLRELPLSSRAVVLRSYVDQGKAHPRQWPGHRMTSLAQSASRFLERQSEHGYQSYWDIVTDEGLDLGPGAVARPSAAATTDAEARALTASALQSARP